MPAGCRPRTANIKILLPPLVVVFGSVRVPRHQAEVRWATVQCVPVLVVNFPSVIGLAFPTHPPQHPLPCGFLLHSLALLGRGVVATVHLGVFGFVVALLLESCGGHGALIFHTGKTVCHISSHNLVAELLAESLHHGTVDSIALAFACLGHHV